MDDFGDMTAAFGNDRMFGFSLSPGGDTDYDAPSPDLGGFDPTSAVLICSSGAIVSSGEVIDDAVIASGGNDSMYVTYGGTANSTTVNFGGVMTVSRGTVNAATVNSYGGVSVFGGGIARQTVVNSCGSMNVADSGTADSVAVNFGGYLYVSGRGTVKRSTVASGGNLIVYSGGTATSTTVESGGSMHVRPQGNAVATVVSDGGRVIVSSGGNAGDLTLCAGGTLNVFSFAEDRHFSEIVNGSAMLAENVFISGSEMHVSSGGVIDHVVLGDRCRMSIASGGTANSTVLVNGGTLTVASGGRAVDVVWTPCEGRMVIEAGAEVGFADELTGVYYGSNGQCTSHSESAGGQIIAANGAMCVMSGGLAEDTTLDGWAASMTVFSGGTHRGSLRIGSGTSVAAFQGAVLDFTVAERTPEDDYLINDLSRISGAPTYTVTVGAELEAGVYKLAQGAADFSAAVTIGDGESVYGDLRVNGAAVWHDGGYRLVGDAGNLTLVFSHLYGDSGAQRWSRIDEPEFTVEYSKNGFATVLTLTTDSESVNSYGLPTGTYQWRVCDRVGNDIAAAAAVSPQLWVANDDGGTDLFFASGKGVWGANYAAQHLGTLGGWGGTREKIALAGKNKLTDIFVGSTDANVLVMTDDANGDALFVDDIFSDSPVAEQQARLARIREIRAGAGDDIIDLTSQRFACVGDGVTVYGGAGDDVIWANCGGNVLFGDAGNDRIVGGSGDDVIVGGSGDDSLHGGGGSDIFCFGANWGVDTVEQLADGTVTLWFESGSLENWNEAAMTYIDGVDSVTVSGVTADRVTLKFGGDTSGLPEGVFAAAASENIFEDKSKGLLA